MKKLNKFVAVLVALAMMAALAVTSAFAAGIKGSESTPATATLVKQLQTPEGADPTSTFTWVITEDESDTKKATIGENKSLSFAKTDNGAKEEDGLVTYTKTLSDVFGNVSFPDGVGVYNFEIVEQYKGETTSTTVPETGEGSKTTTTIEYSNAKYTAQVGVAETAKGDPYVDSIAVRDEQGKKVDAGSDPTTNTFKYINKLTQKITNVDPKGEKDDPLNENDKTALDLTKKVVLADGSKAPTTDQEFSFKVVLTKAALDTREDNAITYAAQRVSKDGTKKTDVTLKIGDNEVKLADGERLVLKDVDVGLGYLITEAKYPAYTTEDNMTEKAYVSVDGNTKGFTNTYKDTDDPATGLSINNLPYIVLALVAVGGLVAYAVARRKADNEA